MNYHSLLENNTDSFTAYKIKDKAVVSLIHGGHALILSDEVMTQKDKIFRYNVYNHLASERIRSVSFETFKNVKKIVTHQYSFGQLIVWRGKKILKMNKEIGEGIPQQLLNGMDYVIKKSY